jgi:LuxR family maltose regulon positive regulatory protein
LRADELRFTLEETMMFLKAIAGLAFAEEEVAMLEEYTEGWIAGLQLVALSLKGRSDSAAFIAAFTGSHRYILDYLTDEVISQQIEAVQQFLLRTSVLDGLSGALCDTVTGQDRSQAILEQLERANLFIVPLDDERSWYRYHHLLTDVLRRQLQQSQSELIPQLHDRAAAWYEQHGFITEAIGHALTAGAHERAVRLIEQIARTMLARGERQTLQHWLESLPTAYLQQRSRLCIIYALLLVWLYQLESAESYEEIAGALYISMGTVKTHLKHIYGKLNVHTRTQAIARGRELRILSSDPIGM